MVLLQEYGFGLNQVKPPQNLTIVGKYSAGNFKAEQLLIDHNMIDTITFDVPNAVH